jgi:uncharacterized protein involved in type VI secretion and phage assembly
MAIQVAVNIEIEGGTSIRFYKSLSIQQSLHRHHTFVLLIPIEAIERQDAHFFENAHSAMCGRTITFTFEPAHNSGGAFSFVFKGIVTELVLVKESDLSDSFVIRGYSPTILLEDQITRHIFLDKDVRSVADHVLSHYPDNILGKRINAERGETQTAITQYDESNFEFLSRLAHHNHQWFYYDGQKVIFGTPEDGEAVQFDANGVQTFEMALNVQPIAIFARAHNYMQYESYGRGVRLEYNNEMNNLAKYVQRRSYEVFDKDRSEVVPLAVASDANVNDYVRKKYQANLSNLVHFIGHGENPNITIGSLVEASGESLRSTSENSYGRYRVIEITHSVDGNGNYANTFKGIQGAVSLPPPNPFVKVPVGKTEYATVIQNDDPEKLGRVKVKFYWSGDTEKTTSDWLRYSSFYTGGQDRKGSFFIPEIDAQVIVIYEDNNAMKPVVVGSVYHGKDAQDYTSPDNRLKAIHTVSGNNISFIDKPDEEVIQITNLSKQTAMIKFNFGEEGKLYISSDTLITVKSGRDVVVEADGDISLNANNVKINADGDFQVSAGSINMTSNGNFKAKANANISVEGSANAEVKGGVTVQVQGATVKIN